MISVRQKLTACKTVLKSHVNGLVSSQGMAFLNCYVQIELNLELIKTNLKKSFEGLLTP